MITYVLRGHAYAHDIQTCIQIFFPNLHYYPSEEISTEGKTVVSLLEKDVVKGEYYEQGHKKGEYTIPLSSSASEKEQKRRLKEAVYRMLSQLTGYVCPWGFLTGIRPAKRINEYIDLGMTETEAREELMQKFLVSGQKADLAVQVALAERKIMLADRRNSASIYIGIPFCPTRCLYCSFPSYSLGQYETKVWAYLQALGKELDYLKRVIVGKKLQTIYIGGGTPTSLNEEQFQWLMEKVSQTFDTASLAEYTVEAGRPDTVTAEKLRLLKEYGVSRISINPQTMNQKTLDIIGRKHTVEDTMRAFHLAREAGHDNINMDIILGLPEETAEDVAVTLHEIEKLSPENLTVHTLAIKRASRLKETLGAYDLTGAEEMEKMLRLSHQSAERMQMIPYYMYRQKNMLGSFENIGYCKEGKEGIYNVEIREERQTIYAAGSGGASKIVDQNTNRIERIFNVKSVDDYINRIDEMILRKVNGLGGSQSFQEEN